MAGGTGSGRPGTPRRGKGSQEGGKVIEMPPRGDPEIRAMVEFSGEVAAAVRAYSGRCSPDFLAVALAALTRDQAELITASGPEREALKEHLAGIVKGDSPVAAALPEGSHPLSPDT